MTTVYNSPGRIAHYGQHGDGCFPCKLKTIHFSSSGPPLHNGANRWEHDPVKERIEELHGIEFDSDAMNKQSAELHKQ